MRRDVGPHMAVVFISYCHDDQDRARELHDVLAAIGLQCWRDEKCIRTGDDFALEITRAIRQCAAFVLLLSSACNRSDYVAKEVAIAHHFRKPIIPVALAEMDVSDELLPYVVRYHIWNLGKQDVRNLASDLKDRFGGNAGARGSTPVPEQQSESEQVAPSRPAGQRPNLVTKGEYLTFVEASGRAMPHDWSAIDSLLPIHEAERPVTGMSWFDAVDYCDWAGGRLPAGTGCAPPDHRAVSDTRSILEWCDAGNKQQKYVCDPYTSKVVAVMDSRSRAANVGFRCVRAMKPIARNWVHIEGGACDIGTDVTMFERLATQYRLPLNVTRPICNRSVRRCDLHSYTIANMCVTNEEYFEFTKATGRQWPSHWNGKWLNRFQRPFPLRLASLPVANVSADQARMYCIWSHTRLPSYFEYERAAAGATRQLYPWGSEYSAHRCNSVESERGSLASVQEYSLGNSDEGLQQLCGNVQEWVVGPEGTFELRGGSWRLPCELWGIAYVFRQVEFGYRAPDVGFRVVCEGGNAGSRVRRSRNGQ